MTDIQFNEGQEFKSSRLFNNKKPYFVRLVLATGIVSTEKHANYVLLGIAGILIIISIYLATPPKVAGGIIYTSGDELLVPMEQK